MKHEKNGASAPDASPGVLLAREPGLHSKPAAKSPRETATIPPMPEHPAGVSDWRKQLVSMGFFDSVLVVTGELGPIEVIGSPRVVVAVRSNSTFCWIERQPWGWPDASREFLKANSRAANVYAVDLATRLREAAWREAKRCSRVRDARLRERGL